MSPLPIPTTVREPADHLLLDEGADRSRVPDVDPLLEPLRRAPRRRSDIASGGGVK